jgi:hypothetical protein
MQMWGGGAPPLKLDPTRFAAVLTRDVGPAPPDPPPYWVVVTLPPEFNGQPFSLLRNGEVIGKGVATNGVANIPATFADGSAPSGQLQVAFEADNSPPLLIDVRNEDAPRPTSLTGDCSGGGGTSDPIVMQGALSGAPAGSVVSVTYEHESGFTHVEQDTTDAQGAYSTSYVGNRVGDWAMTARYAGNDQYAPSSSPTCTINSG